MDGPPAGGTELSHTLHRSLQDLFNAQCERKNLEDVGNELAPLVLAYEEHRLGLWILLAAHAGLLVAIALVAWLAGHLQAAVLVVSLYVPIIIVFAFTLLVFGVSVEWIVVPRFFAMAMFVLSLIMTVLVAYAIYHVRGTYTRAGITLALLQGADVLIVIGFLVTIDQIAGHGCLLSLRVAELHAQKVVVSPIHHKCVNTELTRPSWIQSLLAALRAPESHAHGD